MIAFSAAALLALAAAEPGHHPWTLLVYAAADNNADGPVLEFLDGVRKAIDDDPGMDVLLLIDRSDKYSKDAELLGEDFTGARLFRLTRDSAERLSGGAHFPQLTTTTDAEIDSSDAANVTRFVTWGKEVSPADRYALLIYSHANGRTMCPDEHSNRDMGIAELSDDAAAGGTGGCHVDFLALELCNMGGIEIAYQWRPAPPAGGTGAAAGGPSGGSPFSADVLLAIPNAGPPLDWHLAFERIRSAGHGCNAQRPPLNPATMTAVDFGRLVIEEGHEGRLEHARQTGRGGAEAAAAYDLRAAAAVKDSVDALARALSASDSKAAFTAFRAPRAGLMNYTGDGPFVDLYDLCTRTAAEESLSESVRSAASAATEQIDRFVIASFGMDDYKGFEPGRHGVFITLPSPEPGRWKSFAWYSPKPVEGNAYGHWAFLADGATEGNGTVENWFELLDTWFDEPGGARGGLNGYKP